jgi:hypothetical protein
MAIAALVLGILAIVFSWIPLVGLALALAAIVLAVVARKKVKSGLSTAGLVLGIIGCVFGGIALALTGALVKDASDRNKELQALVDAQRARTEAETKAVETPKTTDDGTKKAGSPAKIEIKPTDDPLARRPRTLALSWRRRGLAMMSCRRGRRGCRTSVPRAASAARWRHRAFREAFGLVMTVRQA